MSIWIYHTIVYFLFLLILPLVPLIFFMSRKESGQLLKRLGLGNQLPEKRRYIKRIWIHALSVGEVRSSVPLVNKINDLVSKQGRLEIIITTSTQTGYTTAHELVTQNIFPQLTGILFFSFDLLPSLLSIYRKIRPDLICLVETDYWPGFLYLMKLKKIPVILVNGRMSERSLKGYLRFNFLKKYIFNSFAHVMVQTNLDKERFIRAGVSVKRITSVGNIKFDMPVPPMNQAYIKNIKYLLGIKENQRIWLAGSTHNGEEEIILSAFEKINIPELKLILVPRHSERCLSVASMIRQRGFKVAFYSESKCQPIPDLCHVILIDVMGVLASFYKLCDLAFVGGSLVKRGGHNPLEPAMFGKPILFGPDMSDFREVALTLIRNEAAIEVTNMKDLIQSATRILKFSEQANKMGMAALNVFSQNAGAVNKTLSFLKPYIKVF